MGDDSRPGDLAKALDILSKPNATLDRAVDERTALLGLVRDVDGGPASAMTLRQWYAGMALQAVYGSWIVTHSTRGTRAALVEEAAAIADAMVEATDRDRPR